MTEEPHHPSLAAGRWAAFSMVEQLGNVSSEVGRAVRAHNAGNDERMWSALARALELIDLTTSDPRHAGRLKELRRAREVLCDCLVGDNAYSTSPADIDRYFTAFAMAARIHR